MPLQLAEDLIESFAAFRGIRLCLATFYGIIVLTATSPAQTAVSERTRAGTFTSALRVDQGPRIDGLLDDECWQRAVPITNFTQVLPVEGVLVNQGWDYDNGRFMHPSSEIVLKAAATFRF